MRQPLRVLIADDHPIIRQGLRRVIDADADITVVGEATDGRMALEQIQALRPAIAVLDIDMPGLDGFAVARALREQHLAVEIIFLTVYRDEGFFNEALRLNAKGYVLKDAAVTDIVNSIKAVGAGQHYMSPALAGYLVKRRPSAATRDTATPGLDELTPTERRVLALIAEYKTSREIGELLQISYRTVQTHRTNICTKLNLHGSHALMKFALAHQSEL